MDLPIVIKVILGEYCHGKCDVYSGIRAPKCRRNFYGMSLLYRDYFNNVPFIFKDNLQRQSQKSYKPPILGNWLAGSWKQTNTAVCTCQQKHTDPRPQEFAHCPDL